MAPYTLLAHAAIWFAGAALAADPTPIGFVSHFPMVAHQDDELRLTGADTIIVRAPWALIEPREGEFTFSVLDEQLALADRNDLKLVVLLEAGPAHAAGVPWLVEKLTAEKQCMANADGVQVRDPSLFSDTYRGYLERFIERTVSYLAGHRLSEHVAGYNNGCEWWYPLQSSYGAPDRAAFGRAMQARYGTLEALNSRWGTGFSDWAQVQPPPLAIDGSASSVQGGLLPLSAALDLSVCDASSPRIAVTPGGKYTLRADATLGPSSPDGPCGPVTLQIAWFSPDKPQPARISQSPQVYGPGDHHLSLEAVAPEGVHTAWLHVKLLGPGELRLSKVSFTDDRGTELAPNPSLDPVAGGWQFVTWSAGDKERVETSWPAAGDVRVGYSPTGALPSGGAWPLAEVNDWVRFRAESVAEFLQWFAARIRRVDPTRPVITYLTFSFANAFEWDYTQQMAIEADAVARAGSDIGILGMQLSSTKGDCDSVTAALDVVRKYGKPMWAIDLLDFSEGTALGEEGIARLSRSVVQHGGAGVQYYCWWGTPVYNYAELRTEALARIISSTRQLAEELRDATPDVSCALVMPRMPLYRFLPEPPNDWADFMGWYKLLARMGVGVDVWTLEELPDLPAERYRAVFIPDCVYMPPEGLAALSRAANAGARLASTGRFARLDMTGRRLNPGQVTVVALQWHDRTGAAFLGDTYRCPSPTDTPPRLRCLPGSPHPAVVEELVDRLREVGVPVLYSPDQGPATGFTFRRPGQQGEQRLLMVLPCDGWTGTLETAAGAVDVGPMGALAPLP